MFLRRLTIIFQAFVESSLVKMAHSASCSPTAKVDGSEFDTFPKVFHYNPKAPVHLFLMTVFPGFVSRAGVKGEAHITFSA
jgi:hypothetical protein